MHHASNSAGSMKQKALRKRYRLDPKTGKPLYLTFPDRAGESVAVLACITNREASLVMDERIRRVCLEIQFSWTELERAKRFVGDAVIEWNPPVIDTSVFNNTEPDDG
jgi:hypothetical protein